MSIELATQNAVIRTIVPENIRLGFLPRLLGTIPGLRFEHQTYAIMRMLCTDYNGGFWQYAELSNGGGFMFPQRNEPMALQWSDNYFKGVATPEVAGIIASLISLSALSAAGDRFGTLNNLLLDYVACLESDDRELINRAID